MPLLIAGCYAIVSAAWILLSDEALSGLAGGFSRYQQLQTYKGWLFVAASALLIYLLLKRAWKSIFAAYEASLESEQRLQLALTSAGGGIWELDLTGRDEGALRLSGELIRRLGLPEGYRLTMAELHDRRHPDDSEEADLRRIQAIASGGEQPYDFRMRVRCEDGLYRWVHIRGKVVTSPDGQVRRMLGVALDVDEQVRAEKRISQLLRYDPVTGLSRQGKFLADIDGVLAEAPLDRWMAVVQVKLVDLDRLIDDTETVDDASLVRLIGDRLHALPGVLVSRVASDVFALATMPADTATAAQRVARDAMASVLEPVPMPDGRVTLRVQAGGALGAHGTESAIGLLRSSGHALDLADRSSEIEIRWFNNELGVEFSVRTGRVRGLDRAVPHGEIECHYQPLVDLRTGTTSGFEALARWRRQDESLVLPNDFIGLAEEVGKIGEIGEEVLRQACETAAAWPSHTIVAVNVSPLQLGDPAFAGAVAHVLKATGLSPARLELEITENALLRDQAMALERLQALRDLGVNIAVDDFGTGYSSLSLLGKMPFTRLKIDRCFVAGSDRSRQNLIIVDTIINLAHNLGLSITAEGVETLEHARMLAARGVNLAQGFYFSAPVTSPRARQLLSETWCSPPEPAEKQAALKLVQ